MGGQFQSVWMSLLYCSSEVRSLHEDFLRSDTNQMYVLQLPGNDRRSRVGLCHGIDV